MPSQSFRVKNGLEVGTGVTISATGIISATSIVVSGNSASTFPQLVVSGVSTFQATLAGTQSNFSGIVTANTFVGQINSGVGTITTFTSTNASLTNINSAGITTLTTAGVTNLTTQQLNITGLSTFAGIATVTGPTLFTKQLNVSGISTLGNTVVGGATTQLIVDGNARITGILTIGTSSITFNGSNDSVTIGTGVTIFGNTGIISATEFRGNGANLTGVQPFVSGTLMLFQQTAAPTGWTKQTTHNDKTLRVVSGSASSGGTTAFSSVMTSRTPAGTVSVSGSNSGGSIANTTDTGSVSGSNSGGSVSNTTLTTTEMPSHSHSINNGTLVRRNVSGANFASGGAGFGEPNELTNNNTGSSGAHGHGFTNPSWSGSISMNAHSHVFTNPSWSGSGSFTGTSMDFAVQYVDLIIASKN